jgi:hypothetical protein
MLNQGNNIYVNYAQHNNITEQLPDNYLDEPTEDFVLCRDADGNPTAIYGGDSWDLNPYRLSAKEVTKLSFTDAFSLSDNAFNATLHSQIKYILYKIMYLAPAGRIGRLSAAAILNYYYTLCGIGRFCAAQLDNPLAQGMTIIDILSSIPYSKAFLSDDSTVRFHKLELPGLLNLLINVGNQNLSFSPVNTDTLSVERKEDNQHPVIPSRIYLELMQFFEARIEVIHPYRHQLKELITSMADRALGLTHGMQKQLKVRVADRRHTMEEALDSFGLSELYESISTKPMERRYFAQFIRDLQYIIRLSIHFYSGMRDQECLRMTLDCLEIHAVSKAVVDSSEAIVDPAHMKSLLTTTTKFSGYHKDEAWLAPDTVIMAVEVAQALAEGLAQLYDRNASETPLFVSPYILRSANAKFKTTNFTNLGEKKGSFGRLAIPEFRITQSDFEELCQTDPDRDFTSDRRFDVGNLWPISSHQYRRSLAFYAANSGFVSMATVTTQFKHTCLAMARYYGRNNENFLPIFAAKNEKGFAKKLSNSHVAQDYQMAVPVHAVNQLFQDIFGDEDSVLGGTGSFIEKQKKRVEQGEITIANCKETTLKMAKEGQFSYRETILGGCAKLSSCDDFLMGEITECLICPKSIIKPSKIDRMIELLHADIERFEPNSPELKLAVLELEKFENYKRKHINKKIPIAEAV